MRYVQVWCYGFLDRYCKLKVYILQGYMDHKGDVGRAPIDERTSVSSIQLLRMIRIGSAHHNIQQKIKLSNTILYPEILLFVLA